METNFDYTDLKRMEVSSTEYKIIKKIRELHERFPSDVVIIREPEENYGMIYATMPPSWLKIHPPRQKRELSDEKKQELMQRLHVAREARGKKNGKELQDT